MMKTLTALSILLFLSLTSFSQVSFADRKDIWEILPDTFQLQEYYSHPRVQTYLKRFQSRPHHLRDIAIQSEPFIYYVYQETKKRGVPGEIIFIPKIESAYNPFAFSNVGASGLWQIMPRTGNGLGLTLDWWYDGRRDIQESTQAALDYFIYLNEVFDDDWLLAMAAYQAGEGTVRKAQRRNKNAGKPTDYWSLTSLPRSTRDYVPKLLAIAAIIDNPKAYGAELPNIPNRPYFAEVELEEQIDIAQAAELAETSLEEILKLNPGHNRWTTKPYGPHTIIIPINKEKVFKKNLANLEESDLVVWREYQVKEGDTLSKLSQEYDVSVDDIKQVNCLHSNTVNVGQTLLIPNVAQSASEARIVGERQRNISASTSQTEPQLVTHEVKSGDTLSKIAAEYNVTENALRAWNEIPNGDEPYELTPNQELTIWTSNVGPTKTYYTIRTGDSFDRIAKRLGVKVCDLIRWNPKLAAQKHIQPGQTVVIFK